MPFRPDGLAIRPTNLRKTTRIRPLVARMEHGCLVHGKTRSPLTYSYPCYTRVHPWLNSAARHARNYSMPRASVVTILGQRAVLLRQQSVASLPVLLSLLGIAKDLGEVCRV